jgi:dUTP pyrophosphatase
MSKSALWINYKSGFKPAYQTDGSAGLDLNASEDTVIPPGRWSVVSTGLFLEIPQGYAGLVCPRSGLAAKFGVTVLNSPGVIDSDYRGEVKVLLINHSAEEYSVKKGDRIAQIIFMPTPRVALLSTGSLTDTDRGAGGFGSTGV